MNGDDARSQGASNRRGGTAGAEDDAAADAEDDDDEEDATVPGGGRVPLYEGGQMSAAEREQELQRRNAFYESVTDAHKARYDSFNRAKLRTQEVRKLVNATLSQSVPQNVVMVVSAYAKMFAGTLVEDARQVQGEWEAVSEKRADGGENRAFKRIKKSQRQAQQGNEDDVGDEQTKSLSNGEPNGTIKPEPTSPANASTINGHPPSRPTSKQADDDVHPLRPGGAGGLGVDIAECDRGPLLPDHLREALRRYKKRRAGGPVGFTGLSLEGRENTAPRMGGKKLFR